MRHFAAPDFWKQFERLPPQVQRTARKNFDLLKSDISHPSLQLKRIGRFHSVRIGRRHRALGVDAPDGILWFWIGTHAEYDRLIRR